MATDIKPKQSYDGPLGEEPDNGPTETEQTAASYARYSGIAVQMAILIGGGVFGGMKLDERFGSEGGTPVWTLVGTLLGIALAFYIVFRSLPKNTDPPGRYDRKPKK